MKVLIINSLYRPNELGGAERSVEIMARGLKSAGFEPIVVSTAEKDSTDIIDGIKCYYLRIPNLYWAKSAKNQPGYKKPFWHLYDSYNLSAIPRLSRVLEIEKPDLVHTNNLAGFSVSIWRAVASRGIPIVHTIRDHYLLCPNAAMYRNDRRCESQCLRCKFYSISRKRFSASVAAVIGVSNFILTKHITPGYFSGSRIRRRIYSSAAEKIPERSRKAGRYVTFGYAGMLAPAKGIEYLLATFKRADLKDARLLVFGKGMTEDYERNLIERYQSEAIGFKGRATPNEIYRNFDVTVIPSLCDDAFPRVLAESFSAGIPVIATSRGGASEMVESDKTGFTFDPSIDGDLENKLRIFVDDSGLRDRMRENCLAEAREFEIDRTTNKIIAIYDELIR